MIERPSPNFDARERPVSAVVLHYTGMATAEAALDRLCDPEARVSAHYLVHEDGRVVRLVHEGDRAWHAGVSHWRGVNGLNDTSVGIEIVNPGHEWGYRAFPDDQIRALIPLIAAIRERHDVPRANVVGHSDIAPARKDDPGELFPWARLSRHRLCLPRPDNPTADPLWTDPAFLVALQRWGYDVADGPAAVRAFQRRWRPERVDGIVDGQCRAILLHLLMEREAGESR